jgi:predicted enzyme related to lactoylglutathione lyase
LRARDQVLQAVFDWQFNQWGDNKYWLIVTGDKSQPGIDGGLMPRPHPGAPAAMAAVNCFVCTIDVPNLDTHVDKAMKAGATLALPKMPGPDGRLARLLQGHRGQYLRNDPDGRQRQISASERDVSGTTRSKVSDLIVVSRAERIDGDRQRGQAPDDQRA